MSKAKEADAPIKIFKYLKDQNRPYSAGDILLNLHKEFNKARTLDGLVGDGKVREKQYGKQKVYFVDQSLFPEVTDSELKTMDKQIAERQVEFQLLQKECQVLENKVSSLQATLTLQQAQAQLQELTKECESLNSRLHKLVAGANAVTPEESERVHQSHAQSVKQWRKRKRIAMNMVNTILDGYPKSKKEFFEEVGIETDEEYGVSLPTS